MRKIQFIFLLSTFFFLGAVKTNAATGVGICAGKTLISGNFCQLDGKISISEVDVSGTPYFKINNRDQASGGTNPQTKIYHASILGKDQDLFCIDPNLLAPDEAYGFARPFDSSSNFDQQIGTVYAMYVNDSVYAGNFTRYLQAANVAMRAIMARDTNGQMINTTDKSVFDQWQYQRYYLFKNIVKQFEGTGNYHSITGCYQYTPESGYTEKKTVTCGSLLLEQGDYDIARKYYCAATQSCGSYKPTVIKPLDIKLKFTPEKAEESESGGTFTRIVPIKITGLQAFSNQPTNTDPAPYVKISKINCPSNATCSLVEGVDSLNKIPLTGADEATIKLKITANYSDYPAGTKVSASLDVEYYHILNISNIVMLRKSLTTTDRQRMIALLTFTPTTTPIDIEGTPVSNVCHIDENGNYMVGSNIVSVQEYMDAGCCADLNVNDLSGTDLDYYNNVCATGDTVKLCPDCEDAPEGCESYVKQQSIDKIMNNVKKQDDAFKGGVGGTISEDKYLTALKAYDNNRDDIYLYNNVTTDNDYCRLYTSEETEISYPGTLTTASGKYFTFKDNKQPTIQNKIDANFHTNVEHWLNDYKQAIEKEKEAYTEWQFRLAYNNAQAKLKPCNSSTKNICCGGCSSCDPSVPCSSSTCTAYSHPDSVSPAKPDTGKFYKADGSDWASDSKTKVTRTCTSCSCSSSGTSSIPSPKDADAAETAYKIAVGERKALEQMKQHCESASQIQTKWEYLHAPDLTFYYEQTYQDAITGNKNTIVEEVPMVISKKDGLDGDELARISKFWPNFTEDPIQIQSRTSGSWSNATESVKYGGGSSKINETFNYDKSTDYRVGYDHTIYYRTDKSFYSLIPSGQTVPTEEYSFSDISYIDVGYVFNVKVTNYAGDYNWWFLVNNIGHYKANPIDGRETNPNPGPPTPLALRSNIQHTLDNHMADHSEDVVQNIEADVNTTGEFHVNVCTWKDTNEIITSECENCCLQDDPDWPECQGEGWSENFFYRTLATGNINPTGRELGANLTGAKGESFVERVEGLGDQIYNDVTGEYLEYEFVIGPNDMNDIKAFNKDNTYYEKVSCNSDGKECKSAFIDLAISEGWAKNTSGRDKYKYFIESTGTWVSDYRPFYDNKYPEETSGLTYWP